MLVIVVNREDPDQTQKQFWKATSVQNFGAFT